MYYLTPATAPDDHLSAYWTRLHSTGILHDALVKQLLDATDEDFVRVLLTLLEAKDHKYRLRNSAYNNHGSSNLYIVPSLYIVPPTPPPRCRV